MIQNWMLYPAPMGAITQLWAGTTPEGIEANGKVHFFLISYSSLGFDHLCLVPGAVGENWFGEEGD
jgi:retinol dehydrogenase 12